jgi:hypothetical protein
VACRLLAVQAQDARAVRLAVRSRTQGLTAADVDRALDERQLVIGWLNRGTLHLVCAEDYRWLHALTVPLQITANVRRLAQEGVGRGAAERGVAVIERALGEDGPLTRGQLRDRLDAAGVRTAGQALVHVLFLAGNRGLIVRGPMVGREQAFVLVRDWLGQGRPIDHDQALAELARRFLAGHGPADEHDLAKWAGVRLGAARAGLAAIGSELTQRADGLVELSGSRDVDELPPPRLLGAFEPALLGWVSRDPIVGGARRQLITTNGIFRPFMMVGGRAVGTWGLERGAVALRPFGRLAAADREALGADGEDVRRFLGA